MVINARSRLCYYNHWTYRGARRAQLRPGVRAPMQADMFNAGVRFSIHFLLKLNAVGLAHNGATGTSIFVLWMPELTALVRPR